MEQHPVPQHIASFEFKLFGNLTVRQFMTLAIPMTLAGMIFFSGLPAVIRIPVAAVIGFMALVAALVPFNGRPLDKWLVIFIKALASPTQRVWVKEAQIPDFLRVVTTAVALPQHEEEKASGWSREQLLEYVHLLPRGETSPLDVREQIALSRLGFSEALSAESGVLPPAISRSSLPQIESLTIAAHAQPYALPGLATKLSSGGTPQLEVETELREGEQVEIESRGPRRLAAEINFTEEVVIPIKTPGRRLRLVPGVGKTRVRKLHFGPPAGFDLSRLPIRGEKRFEVSEELKRRIGEETMNDQRRTTNDERQTTNGVNTFEVGSVTQTGLEKQKQIRFGSPGAGNQPIPKKVILEKPADVRLAQKQQEENQAKISVKTQEEVLAQTPVVLSGIVPLTNKPNVLSGQVTDSTGMPVAGAIVVVVDRNGIPTRALKTNKLGQFLSATPLSDGPYKVEVEAEGYQFEDIVLNLVGEVMSPVEIKAR